MSSARIRKTGDAVGALFMVEASIVTVVIVVYTQRLPTGHWWMRVALGMQLGGALGNLVDRLIFRTVTDFQTERDNTEEQTRLHMKDPALRLKLARLYARGGQYAKAINQYQMCLSLDAKKTEAGKELEAIDNEAK